MMSGQNVRNTMHASQYHACVTERGQASMMSGQNVRNTMQASQYKDRSPNDVRSECKKYRACLTVQGQEVKTPVYVGQARSWLPDPVFRFIADLLLAQNMRYAHKAGANFAGAPLYMYSVRVLCAAPQRQWTFMHIKKSPPPSQGR